MIGKVQEKPTLAQGKSSLGANGRKSLRVVRGGDPVVGQGIVHVLWTHHVQLRVPDAVLFGKQEGEKLLRKKQKCVLLMWSGSASHTSHPLWQQLGARCHFLSSAQTDQKQRRQLPATRPSLLQ